MPPAMVEPVAKRKAKPALQAEERDRKAMAIQVRGSDEWKAWAEEMARFDGLALAALVDRALRRYGKEIGFPKDAPPR